MFLCFRAYAPNTTDVIKLMKESKHDAEGFSTVEDMEEYIQGLNSSDLVGVVFDKTLSLDNLAGKINIELR